ncbi:MAG: bifunctional diaminohydroxyphosphoribosylaminopyrimidine deaminase/5-amino-6-(5-phosphoribosylamino)uracil reductase RibD [Sulfurovum sp.]|nr:bifunctional diaminohydroxyphosphoribosylaminopyrimidine deaminase/5-amino-6-(5-phosphoribosylamino)uracil reductase RibD [Sulfurovum sp.]MDD3601703.1 bifunctional diaminohydroxyphosphoribosylaminopyrimidine deaminase/5-amino-6-(5-phosphoribosylamino)uracil reductase RibD [Sulfurovum sp.]
MDLDALYMQLALNEAWEYQGLTYPNPPVGAVITAGKEMIAVAAHQKAGTSHAEVLALLYAYENISQRPIGFDPFDAHRAHDFLLSLPPGFFSECTIYVTLEPCSHEGKTPSCANLLRSLDLYRVVVATRDPIQEHSGGIERLKNVCYGVLQKEAEALLEPFVIWQKRAFVLFKIAQTSNAKIGGGYLSCDTSLKHVHRLRSICSKLLIGGNTVRTDRPTLDCRFIKEKAPDVIIYSKEKSFDISIPLFGVEHRKVEIRSDLHFLKRPSLVLVEGGEGMLLALKEKIDWLLIYQTPKLSANNLTYNTDMNLSFLHQTKKDVDLMIWSKKID